MSDLHLFTGLFMGEGSVIIARRRHKLGHWNYRPELFIRMRADDRSLLEWVREHWGGLVIDVYVSPTSGNPMSQWNLSGYSTVEPILDQLLSVPFPAKKRREIQFVKDLCVLRASWPYKLSAEHRAYLEEAYHQLQAIRHYQSADQAISA